ncbi:SPOSA6832_01194, partial [Sporobolomyces salmonicolor]
MDVNATRAGGTDPRGGGAAAAGRGARQIHRASTPPGRRSSIEDRLAPLARYDLCILVDDSPSMVDHWDETRTALMSVVEKWCVAGFGRRLRASAHVSPRLPSLSYASDGIDLHFLNGGDEFRLQNITSLNAVASIFDVVQPFGSTPMGVVMDEILRDYVEKVEDARAARVKVKPLLLLVLTDGPADDPDMVKDILVEFATRLDEIRAPPYQLGIQFIQIGNDPEAALFLKELDDDLKPQLGVRDMVDMHVAFSTGCTRFAVVKSIDN